MFPATQADLIRTARGDRSQAEFARLLDVDRTCLSRYEREVLGAPPSVINQCLVEVGRLYGATLPKRGSVHQALEQARGLVRTLEHAGEVESAGVRPAGTLPSSKT